LQQVIADQVAEDGEDEEVIHGSSLPQILPSSPASSGGSGTPKRLFVHSSRATEYWIARS
jgi:hypothetical protein